MFGLFLAVFLLGLFSGAALVLGALLVVYRIWRTRASAGLDST